MTTIEIRNQVIGKIYQWTDNELLMDIYKLVNNSFIDPEIYRLSDNHKVAIDTAISQIDNGDFLTGEQSDKEVNKWLNK